MDAVTGDIQELVYNLRPPALDELGLAAAIEALAGPGTEVSAEVSAEGDLADLPAAVEVAAYRIAQEALTNVRRHARAARVRVELRREAEALRLVIADDGVGLPPDRRGGGGAGVHARAHGGAAAGSAASPARPARARRWR